MNLRFLNTDALKKIRNLPAYVALVGFVCLYLIGVLPYQEALRTQSFDLYQRLMPRERISAPVVIVDIDEASLKAYGQWPWPRSLMAQLLRNINRMEPAAVALDIIMPEEDRASPCKITEYIPGVDKRLAKQICALPSSDQLLAQSLQEGNIALGVAGIQGGPRVDLTAAPMISKGGDPRPWLKYFDSALANVPELDQSAAGHASLNSIIEKNVVRRVPLVTSVAGTVMPSLTLEILRLATGSQSFSVTTGSHGVERVGVKGVSVATQPDASLWVHYSHHDPERFLSARRILNGDVDGEELRQKLVVVGITGMGLVDYTVTALGERVPGVEVHAQLLENIFDGTTLMRPYWAPWAEAVAMLVLGVVIIYGFSRVNAPALLPGVLVLVAVFIAIGAAAYHYQYWLLDYGSPTLMAIVLFSGMLTESQIREQRQRKILEENLRIEREEAAKFQGEMAAAKRFQTGLVPNAAEVFANEPRIDIAARMEPARVVGGDLYDCFMLDDHRMFFIVGDVCGKGVPASLFMVVSKTLCKSVAFRYDAADVNLEAIINQANIEISRDNPESHFVTAFLGILDLQNGELTYCNAGHDTPLLLTPGQPPRDLEGRGGPPISVVEDFEYNTQQYTMAPHEFLCVVTDGVTEAFNPAQEEYGEERLNRVVAGMTGDFSANDLLAAICGDVRAYEAGEDPSDDMTVMVIRWNGPC